MNERYQHSWRTLDAKALTQDLSCFFLSSADFWSAHLNFGVSDLLRLSSHASDRYGFRVLLFSFSFAGIFCWRRPGATFIKLALNCELSNTKPRSLNPCNSSNSRSLKLFHFFSWNAFLKLASLVESFGGFDIVTPLSIPLLWKKQNFCLEN